MEIYLRTDMSIDELATVFSRAVNVAATNRSSYQREQCRESMSRGGIYYLFEVLGLELLLVQNRGEAQISERSAWPFYVVAYGEDTGGEVLANVCTHLAQVMGREGLEAEVDDLGA